MEVKFFTFIFTIKKTIFGGSMPRAALLRYVAVSEFNSAMCVNEWTHSTRVDITFIYYIVHRHFYFARKRRDDESADDDDDVDDWMVIVWHIRNQELLLLLLLLGRADGWMGGWLDKCYEIEIFGESYRQPRWGRPSQWMRQSADRESTSRDDGGGKATELWWRYYILWEILISQHRYIDDDFVFRAEFISMLFLLLFLLLF